MNIGEKIRKLREQKGLSPERLGMICDISGGYIRRLEHGNIKSITLETARKLSIGLEIHPADLIDEQVELPKQEIRPLNVLLKEAQKTFESMDITQVPLLGEIPTEQPISAQKGPVEYITIPKDGLETSPIGKIYALRIGVNDLIGDKINAGDIIVVEPITTDIISGKIYILRMDKIVSARHVAKHKNQLRIYSSLKNYKDVLPRDVEIFGRVVSSGRWLTH